MTFKGHLNERMPSIQISIKEKKRILRTATKTINRKRHSHFVKYATTLYNEVPKPIQEAAKYCPVITKLKKYLFYKTLAVYYHIENKKKKRGWHRRWCGKKSV